MGAWTEIVDYTVASNTTSVVFNDFGTITKDDFIKVVMTHVNGSASGTTIELFPDTAAGVSGYNTSTNYHNQVLFGSGTTVGASRQTGAGYLFTPGSETSANIGYFKISENNKYNSFVNNTLETGTTPEVTYRYATSSNLTFSDPITSLTFFTTRASGIGTDSRIQIYRLDAEKVADITVASNSTQVDIPVTGSLDPAINKDSEYLLVSEWTCTDGNHLELYPNDLTTSTNYYSQAISGGSTDATAFRQNNPRFMSGSGSGSTALSYTHIKLSEIGA
jgi:hypothetical protein